MEYLVKKMTNIIITDTIVQQTKKPIDDPNQDLFSLMTLLKFWFNVA